MVLRCGYQGGYTNIGFYCEVELSLSSSEIIDNFEPGSDIDIAGIECYSYSEYLQILKNHNFNKQFIYDFLLQSDR